MRRSFSICVLCTAIWIWRVFCIRDWLSGRGKFCPDIPQINGNQCINRGAPIGFTGDIVTEKDGKDRFIDIKKYGIRIFVDAARIMALSAGVPDADTRSRFLKAGPAFGLNERDIEATLGAMSALQRIRLDYQSYALREGARVDNHVQPSLLNSFDQVLLREGLKQAKRLQQQIRLNLQL